MRSFVAVDLPAAARDALAAAAAALRPFGDVRWVEAAALHVTLRFFGDAAPELRDAVAAELDRGVPPLQLQVRGLGRFPPRGAPRVVWAGLAGDLDALAALQRRIEAAALAAGAEPDRRPFRPHVTLGRARSPRGSAVLDKQLQARSAALSTAPFRPPAVTLYGSELSAQGPRHTPLHRVAVPAAD